MKMDEDIKIWRCTVCGWPHEGENPPNNCPRCGVPAEKFELVDLSLLDLEDEDEAAMVDVKELTEADKKRIRSALYRISYGLYVVGSCQEDKINAQICNTVFQITNTPMRVAIGLNKNTLTHEYVKHSGVFTVCILGKEHMDLIGTFGFKSGRDIDKFANVPHHIGVTGAPLVLSLIHI